MIFFFLHLTWSITVILQIIFLITGSKAGATVHLSYAGGTDKEICPKETK
jgi:hypothetical protein